MIQVKELIITDLTRKGSGKEVTSPIRKVLEVYSKDGELLAYYDSQGNYSIEDLVSFSKFCALNKEVPIDEALKKWRVY